MMNGGMMSMMMQMQHGAASPAAPDAESPDADHAATSRPGRQVTLSSMTSNTERRVRRNGAHTSAVRIQGSAG